MNTEKPKKPLRPEEVFLSTYTAEVIQSALERFARVHPPLYQCKYCELQFKELASFAPHTKFYLDKGYCRTVPQITARGRYKEITYTDDFLLKKHTCITINERYEPKSDTEVIEELSKTYDVDTISKDYDPNDFEYRPLGSHWSKPDLETGEVTMLHPNEYHQYHEVIAKADADRFAAKINKPIDEETSTYKMIDRWLETQPSTADDDYKGSPPVGFPGQISHREYYDAIKDMTWEQIVNYHQILRNQK